MMKKVYHEGILRANSFEILDEFLGYFF